MSVTVQKLFRWKPLPEYQVKQIMELYRASVEELGDTSRLRRREFEKIVKIYYPWFTSVDLQRAYSCVTNLEAARECRATADRLNDAYGKQVLQLFGSIDADGNGAISIDEFKQQFARCLKDRDVNECFVDADANGDGCIDVREFFAFVARTPDVMRYFERTVNRVQLDKDRARMKRMQLIFRTLPFDENGFPRRPSLHGIRPIYDPTREG